MSDDSGERSRPRHPRRRRPRVRPIRLTERDRAILGFAAEHRFVLAGQVASLVHTTPGAAAARMAALAGTGWLRSQRLFKGPGYYQITGPGLKAIGSRLGKPQAVTPATYDHEIGLGWVWLAAQRGAFGPVRAIVSEREMRSADRRTSERTELHGVRLGGVGPRGGDRRHYPDLVLEMASGHRVAVELELTAKGRGRREQILSGYGTDRRLDAVLYLTERPEVGAQLRRAARKLDLADLIHVQSVQFGPGSGAIGPGRGSEPVPARPGRGQSIGGAARARPETGR